MAYARFPGGMASVDVRLFSAGVMSGTNTITSAVVDTRIFAFPAFVPTWEASWTGTPAGTFSWEGSNQYDPINNPSATFLALAAPNAALESTAFVQPAGSANSCILNLFGGPASGVRWWRLKYVNTSGSGTLDAWVHGLVLA